LGRPSKYQADFAKQAQKLSELGATDQEVADFFGIEVRTLYRWKHDHDEFCQALKAGKTVADDRVERSLYQRAIGYEQEEVKIFMPSGAEKPVYAPYRAKVSPDVTAAIFWLKNRRAEEWRDVSRTEHTGKDGKAIEIEQKMKEDADVVTRAIAGLAGRAGTAGVAGETQH
jgi:hypothetical protein